MLGPVTVEEAVGTECYSGLGALKQSVGGAVQCLAGGAIPGVPDWDVPWGASRFLASGSKGLLSHCRLYMRNSRRHTVHNRTAPLHIVQSKPISAAPLDFRRYLASKSPSPWEKLTRRAHTQAKNCWGCWLQYTHHTVIASSLCVLLIHSMIPISSHDGNVSRPDGQICPLFFPFPNDHSAE